MNILIINCHTYNRGDEAAVHALVDELNNLYGTGKITLALRGNTVYPNLPSNVCCINQFISMNKKSIIAHFITKISKGKINLSSQEKELVKAIISADIILHAPGGPSIGDTYYDAEESYLRIFDLINMFKKPYVFYAPSMGPFNKTERNPWRISILKNAKAVVLRDPISAEYVHQLIPGLKIYQTLDSALQHDIDVDENEKKFKNYRELADFLCKHEKCIGITITDLLWHPVWSKDSNVQDTIKCVFTDFLKEKSEDGYGIVFIPQLYGACNDFNLMKSYCLNDKDFFVIPDNDDRYDTYFQQYVIGKLYAVIGMRYHSNIFSAKMGTPFISVSYEQKMQGFMEKMKLSLYCLPLNDLSYESLQKKFELLELNYSVYKDYLRSKHLDMKNESYKTTEIVKEIIDKL